MMSQFSAYRGGSRRRMSIPVISSFPYPSTSSAAGFTMRIFQCSSMLMIASLAFSMMPRYFFSDSSRPFCKVFPAEMSVKNPMIPSWFSSSGTTVKERRIGILLPPRRVQKGSVHFADHLFPGVSEDPLRAGREEEDVSFPVVPDDSVGTVKEDLFEQARGYDHPVHSLSAGCASRACSGTVFFKRAQGGDDPPPLFGGRGPHVLRFDRAIPCANLLFITNRGRISKRGQCRAGKGRGPRTLGVPTFPGGTIEKQFERRERIIL